MTAREMFEKLGYELAPKFAHNDDTILYSNYDKYIDVSFILKKKNF